MWPRLEPIIISLKDIKPNMKDDVSHDGINKPYEKESLFVEPSGAKERNKLYIVLCGREKTNIVLFRV